MALNQEQFQQLKTRLKEAKTTMAPLEYQKLSNAISASVEPPKNKIIKSIYEGLVSPVANLVARPLQLSQVTRGKVPFSGRFAGVDITPPPEDFGGLKKDIGRAIETASLAIPVGTLGRLTAAGGAFGLGSSLEKGNPLFSSKTAVETLLGAGTAGAFGLGTKAIGKVVSKVATKVREPASKGMSELFGYTSDTSPDVIKRAITNPKEFAAAQREIVKLGNPKVLSNLQGAVRKMRTDLSEVYKVGKQKLVESAPDVRVGLNEKQTKLFSTITERFGVELPQNTKSFSIGELLELNAEVNSLYSKKLVREGAEGLIVRKGKDVLDELMESSFKGVGAKDFLRGYSAQKTIFDSMDEIFNAFKTKSPKAVSQAYRNLGAAFQEDKFAYLDALQAFEKTAGVDILDQLRAIQLQPFIRKSGKFSFDEIFRLVLLPLTSPKLVGVEAKTLGRLINGAQHFGEFVSGLSGLIEKGQRAAIPGTKYIDAYIKNPKLGLSLEDVSKNVYKGEKDLTTKFLEYAKGKTTLSKTEIMDFARRPELKKGEADLLMKKAEELGSPQMPWQSGKKQTISAQEFADSIRRDLLELKPVKATDTEYKSVNIDARGNISKAPGKNYEEVVFESPITTNGSSHYPNSKNYFAHARGDEVVEGGKKIWREQEIQSDILAKHGVDKNIERARGQMDNFIGRNLPEIRKQFPKIKESEIMDYIKNCL